MRSAFRSLPVPVLLVLATLAGFAAARDSAEAAGFHVNVTYDAVDANPGDFVCETAPGNGECTLRAAIMEANALPGADLVTLGEGEYEKTVGDDPVDGDENTGSAGDFDILGDLELRGVSHDTTVLAAQYGGSVLDVREGVVTSISGLTIHGVRTTAPGEGTCGTAIQNIGTLTLAHVEVRDNFGRHVGSICNRGTLTMVDSVIAENRTGLSGLGAGINTSGSATLTRVQVTGNSATFDGGGIYNTGNLTVTDSTINGNGATGAASSHFGGAIYNEGAMTVTNTTISDNYGQGGGIANFGTGTLTNVTITANRPAAGQLDGGIRNNGQLTVANTIVANNEGGDCVGAVTSGGHNLDSDGSCGLEGAGDISGVDPLLGELADNGGPTMTHALLEDSPAIDASDDNACPDADQRGAARPADGDGDTVAACDIGAYEAAAVVPGDSPTSTPPPHPRGDIDCDGDVDSTDALAILRFLAHLPLTFPALCPPPGPPEAPQSVIEWPADINCDVRVDAVDALALLRFVAGLPLALPPGCGELERQRESSSEDSLGTSPTTDPALGSVSGRIYIDVNGNRVYDKWDLPYLADLAISGYPHSDHSESVVPNEDGTFVFNDLLPGEYVIGLDLIIPGICSSLPEFTWTGELESRDTCASFPNFPDLPLELSVGNAEAIEGMDLAGEPIREITGTIWLDGKPLSPGRAVALGVSGNECWPAEVESKESQAGIVVSHYRVSLMSFQDESCIGADIQLLVEGQGVGPDSALGDVLGEADFA